MLVVAGCQAPPQGRYKQRHDSAPLFQHKEISIVDAVPKYEPYRTYNSRPYEVLGQRYYPLQTGKGFEEEGYASWYGQKFHGHLTSNGETYNMFAMTAAHKTLPLPSYVRVTNLENNRQVIVRVNDRGPFHSDRIIDLSYAASHKLGYQSKGTAKVHLEVIHFDEENNVTVGRQPTVSYAEYAGLDSPQDNVTETTELTFTTGLFIQVAALTDIERARSVSTVLSSLYQVPTAMPLVDNVYKLRLGPLTDKFQAKMLLAELKRNGYPGAYTVEMNL
nr:septal ring lytic transglycosylase RlpA family protein [Alteromonas ponticola]